MNADSIKKMQPDRNIQKKSFKMEVFKYVKLFRSKIIKINLPLFCYKKSEKLPLFCYI
jgi:hypothetical protein